MSDNNIVNNSLVNIKIPECLDSSVKKLTDKPSETIGSILSDLLFLVLGGINQKADLKRA